MSKPRKYSPKRRAVMAAGEDICHVEIFERDNWTCGICNGRVDRRLRQPNPFCGTLDHIVPVSACLEEGWPMDQIHTKDNVQLAHLYCNLNKAAGYEDAEAV